MPISAFHMHCNYATELLMLILLISCSSVQEQLDVALSKTCKHFDVSHYTKVQLAYKLLGKTQVSHRHLGFHDLDILAGAELLFK